MPAVAGWRAAMSPRASWAMRSPRATTASRWARIGSAVIAGAPRHAGGRNPSGRTRPLARPRWRRARRPPRTDRQRSQTRPSSGPPTRRRWAGWLARRGRTPPPGRTSGRSSFGLGGEVQEGGGDGACLGGGEQGVDDVLVAFGLFDLDAAFVARQAAVAEGDAELGGHRGAFGRLAASTRRQAATAATPRRRSAAVSGR